MSVFGKLAFWKKKEEDIGMDMGAPPDLGLGPAPDLGLGMGGMPGAEPGGPATMGGPSLPAAEPSPMGMAATPPAAPVAMPRPPGLEAAEPIRPAPAGGHQMELVSAKLDGIRAALDVMNQRLKNLEEMAKRGEEEHSW